MKVGSRRLLPAAWLLVLAFGQVIYKPIPRNAVGICGLFLETAGIIIGCGGVANGPLMVGAASRTLGTVRVSFCRRH